MLTNQAHSIISTYAADVSGVCSALFEMGGMQIMHDASGCNSTYNTHDEPRWYGSDSLVFISALTEQDAILGNDQKLINDIVETANKFNPNFITIAGTPIPMVIGTDFEAISNIVEQETTIPSFGFKTNGMHSYLYGASLAFNAITERFTDRSLLKDSKAKKINIIGTTPLDFSANGYVNDLKNYLTESGFEIVSELGMNSNFEDIKKMGTANVNLVTSSSGLKTAKTLNNLFGTPFVFGLPAKFNNVQVQLNESIKKNKNIFTGGNFDFDSPVLIIGESAFCYSLSEHIKNEFGNYPHAVCPPDTEHELIKDGIEMFSGENNLKKLLKNKKIIIADPLFKPISPDNAKFISFPHEAFSGRIYRHDIKNLLKENIF